ncbi:Ig-like domain-containing protein [Aphelenchoides fujianensis]|nr:Ig-like domain-containing protein [Aphelenchoides fujianensis]
MKQTTRNSFRFAESSPFSRWTSEGFGQSSSVGFSSKDFFSNGETKSKPRFVPGPWSQCSQSCGSGIRTRVVHCIGQSLNGDRVDLAAFECDGQPRPPLFEPCRLSACAKNEQKSAASKSKSSHFRWEYGELEDSNCAAGKQKSTLRCVDIVQNQAVPFSSCRSKPRPVDLTRACQAKCSPVWDTSEWTEMLAWRVAPNSADSLLILPDAQCGSPKPAEQEACGVVDCAAVWRVEQWSACSRSCGPGEQKREVVCEQREGNGMLRVFNPPLRCLSVQRPPTFQLCNLEPCESPDFRYETVNSIGERALPEALPQTAGSPEDENRVRNRFENPAAVYESPPDHRKLTLNIGGSANLYEGTSIKVKCPTRRNFDRRRVVWTKNGRPVENNAHIKVSTNGALRIFHARLEDAGVYECRAGADIPGNVKLRFKPQTAEENREPEEVDEPTSANDVDAQLLQKIRESLVRLGERQALDEMADVRNPGQLKVDYAIGEWSLCTSTECNQPDGAQIRLLRCRLLIKQTTAFFGVVRPPSSQVCRPESCPHWEASDWSECSTSRCTQQGMSIARREIKCVYPNQTTAHFDQCDRRSRPKIKKECPSVSCVAEWKASIWGQCSKACGDGGVQMRLLRCVWRGTKKPAGAACDPSQRPAAIRACSIPDLPACRPQETTTLGLAAGRSV